MTVSDDFPKKPLGRDGVKTVIVPVVAVPGAVPPSWSRTRTTARENTTPGRSTKGKPAIDFGDGTHRKDRTRAVTFPRDGVNGGVETRVVRNSKDLVASLGKKRIWSDRTENRETENRTTGGKNAY